MGLTRWYHLTQILFVIPNSPSEIKLTRQQQPDYVKRETHDLSKIKSNGVLVNSFYELESGYADHYRKVLGRKAWHIGPFWFWNCDPQNKARRGKEASIDEHGCLKWPSSERTNSVVYACFGSIANFAASQLL
ncbi:hypothetical protein NC651_031822 [Populus alba x Populus x berolinensis]|nr:hypothetical protein NC651_031822 [Populus alba x Populus x berolinensis]